MLVDYTLKARMSPVRAALYWFMNRFLPALPRSCCWAADNHRARFRQSQEGVEDRQDLLTCSCSRTKLSLSPETQQQCRDNPSRQGLKTALPMETLLLPVSQLSCFPTCFCFLSQVLGLHCSPKGCQLIRASPRGAAWRTLCQFLCLATSRES